MKILIINYTGFRENWGSQATSRGLLQFIRSVVPEGQSSQIDILPYPPSHWLDYWQSWQNGDQLIDIYCNPSPNRAELFILEKLCLARFGSLLERVQEADVIFFQGEGSLGSGREFRRSQLLGPLVLAKQLYGKTVISINQSITFKSDTAIKALKAIFNSLDLNYVRELESLENCKGAGWPKFDYIPDMAFFYKPIRLAPPFSSDGPYFCISGSADLQSYDLPEYAKGIKAIAKQWNLHPIFVYSRRSDSAVAQAYRNLGERAFTEISNVTHPDVDQVLPVLAGAQFVIGGRYHTSISSLSQNVPVILTASNSHKSRGLVRMFGESNIKLIKNPSCGALTEATQSVMQDRCGLKIRLASGLKDLAEITSTAASHLKVFLGKRSMQMPESGCDVQPDLAIYRTSAALDPLRSLSRSVNLRHYDRRGILLSKD